MKILDIKHLSVYFKNSGQADFCAVNDVSLSLEQGKILGIVGESGSGKSVTALSILGLLPYPKAYHSENSSVIGEFSSLPVLTATMLFIKVSMEA